MSLSAMVKAPLTFAIFIHSGEECIDGAVEGGGLLEVGEVASAGDHLQ